MKDSAAGEVSRLLAAWGAGDAVAREHLLTLVYGELRRLAAYHMRRESPGHTLQTTALVHEAYLRLAGQQEVTWKNHGHFFAVAAQAMRRVLVDHARRRRAAKRGGGIAPSPLDSIALPVAQEVDLLALDEALQELERLDPREARVVELRFFAGLSVAEIAEALGASTATVERDWVAARAWLRHRLGTGGGGPD